MAKKKKTQLKPVARGFTTTSLPKKAVLEDAPEPELAPVVSADLVAQTSGDGKDPEAPLTYPVQGNRSNSVSPEEARLQGLVDRLQDKTEKEISR